MRTKLSGFEMDYDDTGGTGVPLVLVHGYPLDWTLWAGQIRGLATAARVIAPDLRGFGGSSMPSATGTQSSSPTIDQYATDIRHLLDALGVTRAVIGGISMGGYAALAFARIFPGRVRGLVLVDTRAGADSAEGKKGRDEAIALVRSKGAPAVAETMLPKMLTPSAPEPMVSALRQMMARQSVGGIVGALTAMRDRPDATPGLAAIDVPTLIVHGSEDTLIPPKEGTALCDAIPGSRLVLIPGAAHLPCYEQPDAFNAAVREFLGTV